MQARDMAEYTSQSPTTDANAFETLTKTATMIAVQADAAVEYTARACAYAIFAAWTDA